MIDYGRAFLDDSIVVRFSLIFIRNSELVHWNRIYRDWVERSFYREKIELHRQSITKI